MWRDQLAAQQRQPQLSARMGKFPPPGHPDLPTKGSSFGRGSSSSYADEISKHANKEIEAKMKYTRQRKWDLLHRDPPGGGLRQRIKDQRARSDIRAKAEKAKKAEEAKKAEIARREAIGGSPFGSLDAIKRWKEGELRGLANGGITADYSAAHALAGSSPERTTLPRAGPAPITGFSQGGALDRLGGALQHFVDSMPPSEKKKLLAERARRVAAEKGHRDGGVASDAGRMRIPRVPDSPESRVVAFQMGGQVAAPLVGDAHPGVAVPSLVSGARRPAVQNTVLAGATYGGAVQPPSIGIVQS